MASCSKIDYGPEDNTKFVSVGGIVIVGKFVPPDVNVKTNHSVVSTFIMLHGLGSDKNEYLNFADKLASKGYGYFIYDLRGHGESCKDVAGREVNYKYFYTRGPGSEWSLMVNDLENAIKYLVYKKGVKKDKIGIIGASLGANIAITYAARHKFIPVVILLSPGLEYAGFNINDAIKTYGDRPISIVVSPKDKYSYESSILIVKIAKEYNSNIELFTAPAGHGTEMFNGEIENIIINWIDKINISYSHFKI